MFLWDGNKEIYYIMKEGKRMISNQVLQNTLDGLKSISRTDFYITDMEGKVMASTFLSTSVHRRKS